MKQEGGMKVCKRGHVMRGPNLKTTPSPQGLIYSCRACEKLERMERERMAASSQEEKGA